MMKPLLSLLGCTLLVASAYGQDDLLGTLTSNINIQGLETSFDPVTGIASAKGEVDIKYEGVEIRAGRADYNSNTGDVVAKENVTVIKDGQLFRGENIIYNVKTQELTANHIRSSLDPIFYDADNFSTNTEDLERIDGVDAIFTTHDSQVTNYHVKAKSITIYPGDRVVMRNVKVYAGKRPVFWLPYLVQPLDDELGYFFQPGYSSQWGLFLLNQYGMMHGDHTLAKYHLDLRSAKGVGLGADYFSTKWKDNPNIGHLKIYYAYDSDPTSGLYDTVRPSADVDENRYRIAFQHRIYIPGPEESTWYLDFDITKLSDAYMLEDYYLNLFRSEPQPDNTVKLVKHHDRFTATLLARFQVNDFYRSDERMPELAFDFTRAPIFNTGLYYQGETSIGRYAENLSSIDKAAYRAAIDGQRAQLRSITSQLEGSDPGQVVISPALLGAQRDQLELSLDSLQSQLSESQFHRLHSYHELLYPLSFGEDNWISFVPRIGGGATYYGDVSGGPGSDDSETKGIFHAGFDLSTKFSKVWDDVHNRALGLNGLRHIVQPYVNYSYLNADSIENVRAIDRLTPTTRPRPIDMPLYTATDALKTWNVTRLGVRNTLQTKRLSGTRQDPQVTTHNWLGVDTFVDIFLEDPEFDRDVSNLYNHMYWSPVPWLSINWDNQLPIGDSDYNFTESNFSVSWMPNKKFSWTLGHQFLEDNPLIQDSSLITSRVFTRINENWGFSMHHIYEMDDSTMQYQSYSVHRDLVSWKMALGGLIRNNGAEDEVGLVLTFTLKDFPQVGIPLDLDPNPTGTGGRE